MTVLPPTNNIARDLFKDLEKFGRFQTFQYILICLPLVMVSMIHVNYIFVAENINHRCLVPECEGLNPGVEVPIWWPKDVDPKCFKPVLNVRAFEEANKTCTNMVFEETLENCHEWIYENNDSIVAALNLGCQSWKPTLVGSIHNAGMIVSMMITGWISDKIGRKPTIIVCSIGGSVGVFKVLVQNYYAYLALEFLESILASGLYTVAVVLLIEVGGETKRVSAGVIFSYAVYVGEVLFAFIAMGLKYWKTLILVVYTPMILFLAYGFLLRESTRWQMLRGRMDEAKETLKAIARANKLDVTSKEITDISDGELRMRFNVAVQKEKEKMKDILNSKEIMIRVCVTSVCFFSSSFIYYGMAVHSVLLPGNKYTNFVLTSITSFPGDLLAYYTFNKFGRRISLQCGYIVSAIFLMAQTFIPNDKVWLKVLLFLTGKIGVVVCFTGIYTYSLELFPTSVRGSLVGWGNTAARVGSMLAPLTPLLGVTITLLPPQLIDISGITTLRSGTAYAVGRCGELPRPLNGPAGNEKLASLPSILFASTAIVAALLLTFTPETKNLPLFDTIAQIDNHQEKITTHL